MGINILDIISMASELMLVIAEQDLMQTYAALSNCIQYFRKKVGTPKP